MYCEKINLCDVDILVTVNHPQTVAFLSAYKADFESPTVSVTVTEQDVADEKARQTEDGAAFSDRYLELLALYRKIALALLPSDVLLIHGSALSLDGEGFLFTAVSGTGKSTHSRLWREAFGDRVVMINDDKPLVRKKGDGFFIYGTPWDGKHHLSNPISAPLSAIAILERSAVNFAKRITPSEATPTLLMQIFRPATKEQMSKVLTLFGLLVHNVPVFRIGVNMEKDAALVTMRAMNSLSDKI